MSRTDHARVEFTDGFHGKAYGSKGSVQIGSTEETMLPYELLLSGLAACVYSTFLTIIEKKKLTVERMNYELQGSHQEKSPQFLRNLQMDVTIEGYDNSKEDAYRKSFELATEYCSMYQTIAKVADIQYNLTFIKS